MLLVYLRSFVGCTLYSCSHVFHDILHWEGFAFEGEHPFFCSGSMLLEGVHVFMGSVWAFCAAFAQLHMLSGSLWVLCSCLGCVEPLPISLGTETFPSWFGLCDAYHANDFDVYLYVVFIHLDGSFANLISHRGLNEPSIDLSHPKCFDLDFCLALDQLDDIFRFCLSNHFLCYNVVNTLIKGEIEKIKLIWALIW